MGKNYFVQPLCSHCNKKVEGISWRLTATNLQLHKNKNYQVFGNSMVYNTWEEIFLKDRYIHDECYDEYFGDEE